MASQPLSIAAKIKALRVGGSFVVYDNKDRQLAQRQAKALKDAGVLLAQIVTRTSTDKNGKQCWKICAI